jgi:hypothetical protein
MFWTMEGLLYRNGMENLKEEKEEEERCGMEKLRKSIRDKDRLCGLVVRVLGYRSGGPDSIPGTIRKKSSGSGTGSTQPREYN